MNTYDIENKIKSLEIAYNNLCCLIRKCLGIKSTGDSDKFLNQKGEWKNISSPQLIIEVTYSELLNLISSNSLVQDTNYLITDFKTVHYIQYSGSLGNEEIHVGNTEPMIVTAVSNNELYHEIVSTIYPEDKITWKPIFNDREYDAVLGQSTGVITSRRDTKFRLERDYDWRNVIFRRWELTTGIGDFLSYTDTGFAYQDFPPFVALASTNSEVVSPLLFASNLGIPYQLDNIVFMEMCFQNFIKLGYACTFADSVYDNEIGTIFYILHQNKMSENNFEGYSSTSITGDIRKNNIQNVSNNNINGDFKNNLFANFEDNTINSDVLYNIGTNWYNNTIGGTVAYNNISTIEDNNITGDFANNSFTYFYGNTITSDVANNIGTNCFDNTIGGNVAYNNINIFAQCSFSGDILYNNIQRLENSEGNTMSYCNFNEFYNNQDSPNCNFENNNIVKVRNNSFDPSILQFSYNKGTLFQDNSLSGDFNNNDFGSLTVNTINGSVNNNKFLANIASKTFTPTASMSAATPSITLNDTTNGDAEQVLTGGVLSYTPF